RRSSRRSWSYGPCPNRGGASSTSPWRRRWRGESSRSSAGCRRRGRKKKGPPKRTLLTRGTCRESAVRARLLRLAAHLALTFRPLLGLAFGFRARLAVPFLDAAHELRLLPVHLVEVVVGQLAPLLLRLTTKLLPVALDRIPVHRSAPL